MVALSTLLVSALSATIALAQSGDYGPPAGGYGDSPPPASSTDQSGPGSGGEGSATTSEDTSPSQTAPTPAAPPVSTSVPDTAAADNSGLTGSTTCTSLMCITAIVNGSTTTYELKANTQTKPGWMAVGFGQQMANTPMVILWENQDGSMTLSQRQAPAEVMPTVVASPPRIAQADISHTDALALQPQYAFTIPSNGDTHQNLIWAFGGTNPGSSAEDATLIQHLDSGAIVIDLTTPLDSSGTPTPATGTIEPPLLPYQKLIVAHAIVATLAFLLLLPTGALFARLLRTNTTFWFKGHWLIQFYITGPVVVTGIALAVAAVQQHGGTHFSDRHKLVGLIIFIFYILQCSLGAFVHFVKNANRTRRPPQNYLHAVFGLSIIGLSLYQVHRGYSYEWPLATGRGPVPKGVNIVWYIWIVLLPVLYAAGLTFLPRQFRQESEALRARMAPPKMEMSREA